MSLPLQPPPPMPITPEDVINLVHTLPSLPAVVLDLMQSFDMDETSAHELAEKISHDQGLAARSLRLANSTFYGMPKQVKSIHTAIAVLGINAVRSLVIAVGLTSFRLKLQSGFDFDEFWQKTIVTAVCAKHLAPLMRQSAETAFLAGMLHDMGQLVIADCFPAARAAITDLQAQRSFSLSEAEQTLTGTDHAAIGAALSAHWQFPTEFVDAVGAHHDDEMPSGLAQVVWLANLLAHGLPPAPVDSRVRARLALNDASFDQLVEQITAEHAAICQVFIQ